RVGLEPPFRDGLAAQDGQPVRAGDEPLLGALDGLELLAQILCAALVELVEVELGGLIPGVELVLVLGTRLALQTSQLSLDPRALGGEQLTCAFRVHVATLASVRLVPA